MDHCRRPSPPRDTGVLPNASGPCLPSRLETSRAPEGFTLAATVLSTQSLSLDLKTVSNFGKAPKSRKAKHKRPSNASRFGVTREDLLEGLCLNGNRNEDLSRILQRYFNRFRVLSAGDVS